MHPRQREARGEPALATVEYALAHELGYTMVLRGGGTVSKNYDAAAVFGTTWDAQDDFDGVHR